MDRTEFMITTLTRTLKWSLKHPFLSFLFHSRRLRTQPWLGPYGSQKRCLQRRLLWPSPLRQPRSDSRHLHVHCPIPAHAPWHHHRGQRWPHFLLRLQTSTHQWWRRRSRARVDGQTSRLLFCLRTVRERWRRAWEVQTTKLCLMRAEKRDHGTQKAKKNSFILIRHHKTSTHFQLKK